MSQQEPITIKPCYRVAMFMYEEFCMLDLIGPAEVFGGFPDTFKMHVIGKSSTINTFKGSFKFITGLSLEQASEEKEPFDMIVIPGGDEGTKAILKDKEALELLNKIAQKSSIVFSICTGSLILANAGLLGGKNATTNKMVYHMETPNYPSVNWQLHARWVHDGKFITSSGITAGIDAAFYIVSRIKGKEAALNFSKLMEYNVTWDPANDPFATEKDAPPNPLLKYYV